MPNLTYSIREEGGTGGRTTILGMRAAQGELGQMIKDIVDEAAKQGEAVAKSEAPRNKEFPQRNAGRTISESIRISQTDYRPGGVGGGGTHRVELIAGEGSPHFQYVWEGTGHFHGRGNIKPVESKFLVFRKRGAGLVYAKEVKGQPAQQEWWEKATESMESFIQDRVRSSGIGEAVRK